MKNDRNRKMKQGPKTKKQSQKKNKMNRYEIRKPREHKMTTKLGNQKVNRGRK